MRGVLSKIKRIFPNAHFVHCYAHQLNLLMEKATHQILKILVFFGNLSSIPTFFANSSNRCKVIENVVKQKLPKSIQTRWNYNIRTVNLVFKNRLQL